MLAWLRRLAHDRSHSEPRPSEVALEHATAARQQAEARRPVVQAVAGAIRRAREENHFRERIEAAFRGAAQ